eukprot:4248682-Heterocapsa_arctica.AAC.1
MGPGPFIAVVHPVHASAQPLLSIFAASQLPPVLVSYMSPPGCLPPVGVAYMRPSSVMILR